MPQRWQRKRAKGWRMPAGAVYVGRPTKWGNPFRIGDPHPEGGPAGSDRRVRREDVAGLYRAYCMGRLTIQPPFTLDELAQELGGHDLVCWCRLDQPCHADVLLELANP